MKEYGESYAVRARTIVPMTNEKAARGKDLFEPISSIDNGVLLVHKNYVVACGKKKDLELPKGLIVHDLGDVSLIPGVINCHAHIDISHLAGKHSGERASQHGLQASSPSAQDMNRKTQGKLTQPAKRRLHSAP